MRRTGDECDQCGRRIRFASVKDVGDAELQFCSVVCLDRRHRDVAIWTARLAGESVADIGKRLNLRRELVQQCCVRQQARDQARAVDRSANATLEK